MLLIRYSSDVKRALILKCVIFVFVFMLAGTGLSMASPTIISATVEESDYFYSPIPTNNIINILVVANESDFVEADFSNITSGCDYVNMTYNVSISTYNYSCNLTLAATNAQFISAYIIIIADNSSDFSGPDTEIIPLVLYNMTIPPLNDPSNCSRFGSATTNFATVQDFEEVNFIVDVELNQSCLSIPTGSANFTDAAKINFTSINLSTSEQAEKLQHMREAINVTINRQDFFGDTIVSVNSSYFSSLNSSAFINLYNIPFYAQPNIESQVPDGWNTSTLNWTPGNEGGNLSFSVYHFSDYSVTDNSSPIVTINYPLGGEYFNTANITINVTLNGTGTGISNANFTFNGVQVSNRSNCTRISLQIYSCVFSLNLMTDGSTNFSIAAFDYGGDSPGNVGYANISFHMNASLPNITIASPTNATKTNGTLIFNFSAFDGSGISECWYSLSGTINTSNVTVSCINGTYFSTVLHVQNGSYTLIVYANDSLANPSSSNVSFYVNDTTGPTLSSLSPHGSKTSASQTLSVITNENATCKYAASNLSFTSMTSMTDTVYTHTKSITAYSGDNTFYIKCQDMSGNEGPGTIDFTVTTSTTSPSSSTSSNDVPSTEPTMSIYFDKITSGATEIDFSGDEFSLINVSVNSTGNSSSVTFELVKTTTPSKNYTDSSVYEYFNINHENLADSSISGAHFIFKVPLSWLTSKSLTENDVLLLRYTGSWKKLQTRFLKKNSQDAFYEAISPGLSLFAVGYEKKEVVVLSNISQNQSIISIKESNISENFSIKNITKNESNDGNNGVLVRGPNIPVLVIILILIVGLLATILSFKMRKKEDTMKNVDDKPVKKE